MKKSKAINIILTAIMVFTNVFTPQMAMMISANIGEEVKETEATDNNESPVAEVAEPSETDNGTDGDTQVQTEVTGETSADSEIEPNPANTDDPADETPTDTNNNDPPVEKESGIAVLATAGITGNPIDSFKFEIQEKDSTVWRELDSGGTLNVHPSDINNTRLTYDLSFDDDDVINAGDTYTIQLPDIVKPFRATTEPVILIEDTDITYTIDESGQLTISFPSGWEDSGDARRLHIDLIQSFNDDLFEDDREQEVNIPYSENQGFSFILVGIPEDFEAEDYKENTNIYRVDDAGSTDTNKNATHADWKVRINDELGIYDSVTVSDDLIGGHAVDLDMVKIYLVPRNKMTGESTGERVDVTSQYTVNDENNGFSIDFGAIKDTFEIEYTTNITQKEAGSDNTTLLNTATINYDNTPKTIDETVELEWPATSKPIIKTGETSPGSSEITWKVYYNYEKENYGDVTLVDELSHGTVDLDSVEVWEVENPQPGDLNPWASGANATKVDPKPEASLNDDGNMTFSIRESDGKAYYIEYKSHVPGGLNEEVTNTIDDENENTPPGTDEVTVSTPVGDVEKTGKVVYEGGVAYIDWTVTFNENRHEYDGFEFKDEFDKSLINLVEDSIVLKADGDVVNEGYTFIPAENGGSFTFKLDKSERKVYTLTYRTSYTDIGLKAENVKNNIPLYWNGIGPEAEIGHPKAGIVKDVKYVTGQDGEQNRLEMEWIVKFNTNNLVLKNPTLSDRFQPKEQDTNDMEIVGGEAGIKFYTIVDGIEVDVTSDYEVTLVDNETGKGFDIQFTGDTEPTTYYVKYNTTAPTNNLGAKNNAVLKWQGYEEADKATKEPGPAQPDGYKNSEVATSEDGTSRRIDWEIVFNTNKLVLQDVIIEDTYTPADVDLVEGIKIVKLDNTENGTELTLNTDYSIIEPFGDGNFTIKFIDQTEPVEYKITYSTEYGENYDYQGAHNKAVIKFTGGENTREESVRPYDLKVEKSSSLNKEEKPAVITWEVKANSGLVTLKDAILTDAIEDDQAYVKGSMKLNGEAVAEDAITWNGTEFTISLPNGAKAHTLTFETEIVSYPSNYYFRNQGSNQNKDTYYNQVFLINYSNESEDTEGTQRKTVDDNATARYHSENANNNPSKSGKQDADTDLIVWTAEINPGALPIKDAHIEDILDTNQVYFMKDGEIDLVVERLGGETDVVVPSENYTVVIEEVDNVPKFTLTFKESDDENEGEINHTYRLTYKTSLRDQIVGEREISNMIKVAGQEGNVFSDDDSGDLTAAKWYFGGSGSVETLDINVVKVDKDNNEIPLEGVEFTVENIRNGKTEKHKSDENGEIKVTGLRAGRYVLTETKALPNYTSIDPIYFFLGYGDDSPTIDLTTSDWSLENLNRVEGATITVQNEKQKTDVTANKVWNGDNPAVDVWFKLNRQVGENGTQEAVPNADTKLLASASNTTEVTWEGLESKNAEGEEYIFSVIEVDEEGNNFTPVGFTKEEKGLTVTNTSIPIDVPVQKEWDDEEDQDGIRVDEVEVQLLADGAPVTGRVETLNAENEWTHTFTGLSAYNDAGELIKYSIEETDVPEGYTPSVELNEDGVLVLTNTHIPATTDLTVLKSWQDAENQDGIRADEVEVQLVQLDDEGNVIETFGDPVILNDANDWTYTWTALPVNSDGEEIKYSVAEDNVPEGYVSSVSDIVDGTITVTNKHIPEEISINGTKTWEDAEDQDGKRPEEITVVLLNGETIVRTESVTADDNWKYEFTNLPKYQNGEEIAYRIQELGVDEYSTEIKGYDIINSHTPEEISINVVKLWDDENYVAARPESVTVNLFANGEETDYSVELTADNGWQAAFTELDKYADSEVIEYTIEEEPVEGYKFKSLTGNASDGFQITNEPIKVSVGDYVWIDENKDGLQDDMDTPLKGVVLTLEDENGNPVTDVYGNPVEPTTTDEEGWYTFDNLPADKTYTVKIDRIKSAEALKGLAPTLHEVEDDKSKDSSTWEATSRHLVEDEDHDPTLDFGFFRKVVSVGDYVWIDINRDGLQDDTDIPIEGVVLIIVDSNGDPVTDVNGDPVGPTTTDEKGWYTFDNLPADETYKVIIDQEASVEVLKDFYPTVEYADEDNSIDSSTWEETSRYLTEDGERDPTLDFGFVRPAVSVGDYVWFDTNEDGLQDETDVPLEGVVLTIVDENGNPVTDVYGNPVVPQRTDENGHYSFDNLPIDKTYTVIIDKDAFKEKYPEYAPTSQNVGEDNEVDSSTWEVTSRELTEDGERDPSLDFGFVPARVSVGDYVWIDVDRDGLQDDTDIPIKGVVLKLEDADGEPVKDIYGNDVKPTTTDEKGWYTFENLPINNTYVVRIDREASAEALNGLDVTLEHEGEDDSVDSSTWTATSRYLTEHLDRDPTLDFGFIRKRVSVGDYVWLDENKDGKQDEGEPGIPGVVLVLTDEEGNPVTDVYGNPVEPTTTDENGHYTFDNLPINNKYIVSIDREASKEALKDLIPTLENSGGRDIDSSTWQAISEFLDQHEQRDPTLDFGFVVPTPDPVDPEPEEPEDSEDSIGDSETPEEPEESPEDKPSGLPAAGESATNMLFGLVLLVLGGLLVLYDKKWSSKQ